MTKIFKKSPVARKVLEVNVGPVVGQVLSAEDTKEDDDVVHRVICSIESLDNYIMTGWAYSKSTPSGNLPLNLMVDGQLCKTFVCDTERPELAASLTGVLCVGFKVTLPDILSDGFPHRLQISQVTGDVVTFTGGEYPGADSICVPALLSSEFLSNVDGIRGGALVGWALRTRERDRRKVGSVRILVSAAGQPLAELVANVFRPDVALALGSEAACGFSFPISQELIDSGIHSITVRSLPDLRPLVGSPAALDLRGQIRGSEAKLFSDDIDELFKIAYRMKIRIDEATVEDRYPLAEYSRWFKRARIHARQRCVAKFGKQETNLTKISIVCPVYRPDLVAFQATLDSVRAQSHQNWELILVDDGSEDASLGKVGAQYAKLDARVKWMSLRNNVGISRATNAAIKEASGSFIAFIDHDDLLEPHALECMLTAACSSKAKLIYSDEDKVDDAGYHSEPFFKPDFSPRLLLEYNYISHFCMMRSDLVQKLGGLDASLDGAQDHDFLLRAIGNLSPEQVCHVPEVLYHWRKSSNSTALSGATKPYAARAGRLAVTQHLERRKVPAIVKSDSGNTRYNISWDYAVYPAVSIIIPFRNQIEMTEKCVRSVLQYSQNLSVEIILVDNWSDSMELSDFRAKMAEIPNVKILEVKEPFNYSRINNIAVREATNDFLLFLNNDVEICSENWLQKMLGEMMSSDDLGAVGIKLLYPNQTVQHGGVVLGAGGIADHAFRGVPPQFPGYFDLAKVPHEVTAVTAACLLCRKAHFIEVGGFDENYLRVAFNDVDLCLKIRRRGLRIIVLPTVYAIHHESLSRGSDTAPGKITRFMYENARMREKWGSVLTNDPYYNINFSRKYAPYAELRTDFCSSLEQNQKDPRSEAV